MNMWDCGPSAPAAANSDFLRFAVINSLLERKIEKRPDKVRLQGRILFLTEDPELDPAAACGRRLPLG